MLACVLWVASVQMWTAIRTEAINRIKVQAWRPKVLNAERVLTFLGEGSQIERNVMINELSQVSETGSDIGVVSSCVGRIGVQHCIGQRLQLGIAHLQRSKLWEHSTKHARIFVAGQCIQVFACRMTPGYTMAGNDFYRLWRRRRRFEAFL